MSNLSLKAAFKEDKFNLKTILVIFILIDLFVLPIIVDYHLWNHFFYLVLYETSILTSLMFGLRGLGKYKNMMISLQSIARNREMSVDERESRLVSMIHNACLELGYIYQERNEEDFKKKRKLQEVKS